MEKHVRLREPLVDRRPRQGLCRPKPGRLRVRCLGARELRPFQVQIFSQGANSDPYAVLCIRRNERHQCSWTERRCTRPVRKTRHPCWREEFWFNLPSSPEQTEYSLEVNIYGVVQGRKQDEFLGCAELAIPVLEGEERKVSELRLSSGSANMDCEGRVRLELSWEAAIDPAAHRDHVRIFASRGLNTVMGLRFFSIANLAIGGLLLLVAQGSRWLCGGDSFADCKEIEVPGARVAAVLGGMSAIASSVTNFLGAAGFLGSTWREGTPAGLLDGVQSGYLDLEDDRASAASRPTPTLQLQVKQKHLFVWDVSVMAADLCPVKISMISVRLLTWFGQGVALIMASLALFLSWLVDSQGRFLGEGSWIALTAWIIISSSALLSGREAFISSEHEEQWTTDSMDVQPRRLSYNAQHFDHRGWSPARAVSGIEDFMSNLEEGVKAVKHEAENLQRPFLAAGEDLNTRMKNFMQEVEQQVMETANRFQAQLSTRPDFQDEPNRQTPEEPQSGCMSSCQPSAQRETSTALPRVASSTTHLDAASSQAEPQLVPVAEPPGLCLRCL